jgi:hypothetical protein
MDRYCLTDILNAREEVRCSSMRLEQGSSFGLRLPRPISSRKVPVPESHLAQTFATLNLRTTTAIHLYK